MLEVYQEVCNLMRRRGRGVLATVIESLGSSPRRAGAKMLIREDGTFVGTVGGGGVEQRVREKAAEVIASGTPQVLHLDLSGQGEGAAMICGGQMDVLLEPVAPEETLYLFGAGHISQSTVHMARMLGFTVTVVDPRPEYNNAVRFPAADSLVVEDYEKAFPKLSVDENSYIVIYTPGHVLDEQCLEFAVGTRARYVGMIGSKKKVKEVKERLLKKGVLPQQLERVHAPIGLEIGAETPEEIAISILAEIVRERRAPQPAEK